MHPGRSLSSLMARLETAHVAEQRQVRRRPRARCPTAPVVIAAARHAEYPSAEAFNYPQVVAAAIRFGAFALEGVSRM